MPMSIDKKIEKLEEENEEFRDAIGCIKTDLAVIKEKYQSMNDKISIIDDNFNRVIQAMETLRTENNNQHKAMIKTLIAGTVTLATSIIGAISVIVAAIL
jgi:predicted nuclease with TOPRIM domain